MLHNKLRRRENFLWVDGVKVNFSLAGEGTKVSILALHALVGLII